MDKKKLYAIMILVVVLACLGTGTLAYFTTVAVAHNVITTAGVDIELVDNFPGSVPDKDGNKVLDGIMPGSIPDKVVSVTNKKTSAEAWVRVGIEITVTDSQGKDITAKALKDGILLIPTNETGWIFGEEKDGVRWYYYKDSLDPGQSTTNLFEKVEFNGPNMGNEYQSATVTVAVSAHGVQTANNPIPDGGDVTGVQGWPNV